MLVRRPNYPSRRDHSFAGCWHASREVTWRGYGRVVLIDAARGRIYNGSMGHSDFPVTPGVRFLREQHVEFSPYLYTYVEHGGTCVSAEALGVSEHDVVKTLVMETEKKQPLVVLMHGDREVSTKALARAIGVKQVAPCHPDVAQKHTGYLVGGTSPFGTRKTLPVYVQDTIFALPRIYINGGKRGFLVAIDPAELTRVLNVVPVSVAIGG